MKRGKNFYLKFLLLALLLGVSLILIEKKTRKDKVRTVDPAEEKTKEVKKVESTKITI